MNNYPAGRIMALVTAMLFCLAAVIITRASASVCVPMSVCVSADESKYRNRTIVIIDNSDARCSKDDYKKNARSSPGSHSPLPLPPLQQQPPEHQQDEYKNRILLDVPDPEEGGKVIDEIQLLVSPLSFVWQHQQQEDEEKEQQQNDRLSGSGERFVKQSSSPSSMVEILVDDEQQQRQQQQQNGIDIESTDNKFTATTTTTTTTSNTHNKLEQEQDEDKKD